MSKRVDYYHDPEAPTANSLVVGGSAVVVNDEGRIVPQRRSDSGNWALPGGAMDIGETFAQSVIREVKEETGFDVRIERIIGIYSDQATCSPTTTARCGRSSIFAWPAQLWAGSWRSVVNRWMYALLRWMRWPTLQCTRRSGRELMITCEAESLGCAECVSAISKAALRRP